VASPATSFADKPSRSRFSASNITTENIHLKHYMNVTWVSRPIAEDRPTEQELFGEFYGTTSE
jgi:hypothetical protein